MWNKDQHPEKKKIPGASSLVAGFFFLLGADKTRSVYMSLAAKRGRDVGIKLLAPHGAVPAEEKNGAEAGITGPQPRKEQKTSQS